MRKKGIELVSCGINVESATTLFELFIKTKLGSLLSTLEKQDVSNHSKYI